MQNTITIGGNTSGGDTGSTVECSNTLPLMLIAGPCAIESYDHCIKMADLIGKVCDKYNTSWIFKACYDKDCRSSPTSFHGVGLEEGLAILERVRSETGLPVTSDFSNRGFTIRNPAAKGFFTVCKFLFQGHAVCYSGFNHLKNLSSVPL